MLLRKAAGIFILWGLFVPSVAAQSTTAVLTGTVTDEQGAVIVGAAITVQNTETGIPWTAVADPTGNFRVGGLPPGVYELRVERPGFETYVGVGIQLSIGQEARVPITLAPARVVS